MGASLALLGFLAGVATIEFQARKSPPAGPHSTSAERGPAERSRNEPGEDSARPICQNFYKTVCQKRGITRDPTGSVKPDVSGEILALRAYEEIIRKHPEWSSDQVDEELVRTIYTPKVRARIQSSFQWVQNRVIRLIESQPEGVFTKKQKNLLKKQILSTQLDLPRPGALYADEPDLLTKNDVFYERSPEGKIRLRVGGAYLLSARSWFNIVFTLAHEIAHAIDPCELRALNVNIAAYDRLSACFLENQLVATKRSGTECTENDQLSESFSDWLAVSVVGDALATFESEFKGPQLVNAAVNSVRDLCEQDDGFRENDTEFHPPAEVRIERIFGRNPRIRSIFGCEPLPAGVRYCSFNPSLPETPTRLEIGR